MIELSYRYLNLNTNYAIFLSKSFDFTGIIVVYI